jgi:spermidine synthase
MSYLLTAFVSGMAVTVIELAAARLIAPFFGASLFVWTNVIGIILAGLALGYAIGGRLADRTEDARRLYHILGVSGVFASLTPFLVRPISAVATIETIFAQVTPLTLILGSFFATTFLFFVPIVLLGMTSPFLIVLLDRKESSGVGTVAGRVFAWSTLGSILGIFLTGLFFIPFFGTRRTILGAAFALVLLAFVGASKRWAPLVILVFIFLTLPLSAVGPVRETSGLLYEKESAYQYVRVNDVRGRRYLIFNEGGGIQSLWDPQTLATGFYYDYTAPLPLLFPEDRELRILMIGLGGGTIPRNYAALYENRPYTIDVVEIDSVVADVSRRFFHLPEERLRIHNTDGRMFLRATDEDYDLVILDAFTNQYYIPWHLTTKEFFQLLASHLASDGVVAFNVDAVRRTSPLLQAIHATMSEALPYVATVPMPNSWSQLVIAGKSAPHYERWDKPETDSFLASTVAYLKENLRESDAPTVRVLTDDRAPVELLTDVMFFREAVLR